MPFPIEAMHLLNDIIATPEDMEVLGQGYSLGVNPKTVFRLDLDEENRGIVTFVAPPFIAEGTILDDPSLTTAIMTLKDTPVVTFEVRSAPFTLGLVLGRTAIELADAHFEDDLKRLGTSGS